MQYSHHVFSICQVLANRSHSRAFSRTIDEGWTLFTTASVPWHCWRRWSSSLQNDRNTVQCQLIHSPTTNACTWEHWPSYKTPSICPSTFRRHFLTSFDWSGHIGGNQLRTTIYILFTTFFIFFSRVTINQIWLMATQRSFGETISTTISCRHKCSIFHTGF